jgi:hypothetical protein
VRKGRFDFPIRQNKIYYVDQKHDCEFWAAPIGQNFCLYKTLYKNNSAGELIVSREKTLIDAVVNL